MVASGRRSQSQRPGRIAQCCKNCDYTALAAGARAGAAPFPVGRLVRAAYDEVGKGPWKARSFYDAFAEVKVTTREIAIELIQRMPPDVSLTDIIAELYVRQQIDSGLAELDRGESLTQEEVEERLSQWLD